MILTIFTFFLNGFLCPNMTMMMLRILGLLWGLLWLSCAAALQVQISPSHLYFGIGRSKLFVCRVVGDAEDIDWFNPLGEKILPDTPNISVRRDNKFTSTMQISPATMDHAGFFKCVARVPGQEAEATLQIELFQDITFTNAPSPQVFNEGDDADVVCDVQSSPASEIMWKKEHNIIRSDRDERMEVLENGHLLIHNIRKADKGTYHCQAQITSLGVIKLKTINVVVNLTRHRLEDFPPRIVKHPSDLMAPRGDPASLSCKAEGSPTPVIEWYKNGERVETSAADPRLNRVLLPSGTLYFLRIVHDRRGKSDKGVYVCVVRNYLGEAVSQNAKLEVTYAPRIQNQEAVYTRVGNPVNISCQVEAHPAPEMTWFKDGLQLPDIDNNNMKIYNTPTVSYLEVKPESLDDFGWYSCKATNSRGKDTDKFLLVQADTRHQPEDSPPQIVEHPSDVIVFKSDLAILTCQAEGSPTPTIEWYKDGKRLDINRDDPEFRRLLLPSGALFFMRVRKQSDEGVYMCVARNYLGEEFSRNATLEVAYPPKIQNQGTVYTWVGNPVNISCKVEAVPAPRMSWFKDGLQLSDTDYNNIKIYNTQTVSYLEVKPESLNDFGRYSCKATNSLGTDTKDFLLVQAVTKHRPEDSPPQIVKHPSDLFVSKGDPAALMCKAEGSPTPTIKWYMNGEPVDTLSVDPMSNRLLLPDGTLFFMRIVHGRIGKPHEGVYMCVARNYLGEAVSRNATLEVTYAPRIQNRGAVYTWEGNPTNISCVVEAHPAPEMSWFRNGLQLSHTKYNNMKIYNTPTVSYLEVKPESMNDFGWYTCKATNSLGTDTNDFRLTQAEVPSSPHILHVESFSTTAVVRFNRPGSSGGVAILRFRVQWRQTEDEWKSREYEASDDLTKVIITDLNPKTFYEVRMSAINGRGEGESSKIITIKTKTRVMDGSTTTSPSLYLSSSP